MSKSNNFFDFSTETINFPQTNVSALLSSDIWSSMQNNFQRARGCPGGPASDGNWIASALGMRTGDGQLVLEAFFLTTESTDCNTDHSPFNKESSVSGKNGKRAGESRNVDDQKRKLIETALRKAGQPATIENVAAVHKIVQKESSWNPRAVNKWDSNAKKGTPSKGLMQTIEPTFARYSIPGHGNIFRPIDNLIAGIRYAIDRYGSLSNVPGLRALARGKSYRGY